MQRRKPLHFLLCNGAEQPAFEEFAVAGNLRCEVFVIRREQTTEGIEQQIGRSHIDGHQCVFSHFSVHEDDAAPGFLHGALEELDGAGLADEQGGIEKLGGDGLGVDVVEEQGLPEVAFVDGLGLVEGEAGDVKFGGRSAGRCRNW